MLDAGLSDTDANGFPSDFGAVRKIVPLFAIVSSATNARVAANNNRVNARMTPTRRI